MTGTTTPERRRLSAIAALLACVALAGACATEEESAAQEEPTAAQAASPAVRTEADRQSQTQGAPPTTQQRERPAPRPQGQVLAGTITSVVDGDTIKARVRGFETTVRLVGIDTPETRHPSRPVECFGPAASDRVKRILPQGQAVRLVTDPTQDTRDRYDRLLAYVYKPGRSGARGSVNYSLVATGYAKVYIYRGVPFQHAGAFQAAERRARQQKLGLWGPPCNGDTTKRDPSVARPAPPPAPAPAPAPRSGSQTNCDPNYAGACIPPYPPDVNCGDIPDKNFRVVGEDVHGLDGDSDGIACES